MFLSSHVEVLADMYWAGNEFQTRSDHICKPRSRTVVHKLALLMTPTPDSGTVPFHDNLLACVSYDILESLKGMGKTNSHQRVNRSAASVGESLHPWQPPTQAPARPRSIAIRVPESRSPHWYVDVMLLWVLVLRKTPQTPVNISAGECFEVM